MKLFPKLLLATSATLNVVLAIALFTGKAPAPAPVATPPTRVAETRAEVALAWRDLPAEDLPALVQALRDAQFPPHLVRAITAARLHEQYAARRRAIEQQADERFWIAPDDELVAKQLQTLRREERDALRQLVGLEGSLEEQALLLESRGLGFIGAERSSAVRAVLYDFDEQRRQVFEGVGTNVGVTVIDPGVSAKIEALEKAQRAELAVVLTPEELERYDLTASRTANRVRSELAAFEPTEEEYRAIFKLQQAFDEQWSGMSMATASEADRRARFEAQRRVREQAKQLLTPERAAEFERSQDFHFRMASQLVSRLQLPPATAVELYRVQKDIEAQMTMRNGSSEELQARLAQLEQETVRRVGALIGEKYVDTYRRYGGMWMAALKYNPAGNSRGGSAPVIRLNTGG